MGQVSSPPHEQLPAGGAKVARRTTGAAQLVLCYNSEMASMRSRALIGVGAGLVGAAGAARLWQTHHDSIQRALRRFRQGDLAEAGAAKLKAMAELGSERLRVAVEKDRPPPHPELPANPDPRRLPFALPQSHRTGRASPHPVPENATRPQ